jgi:glycosyltransferase involved in cell wall biosynthesis
VLSIIIPTLNKATRLQVCLRALVQAIRASTVTCEIIVVDDGSLDETVNMVQTMRSVIQTPVHLIQGPATGGRSVARNRGAAAATGTRLLFLDDDMLMSDTALLRHAMLEDDAVPRIGRATIMNLPWIRGLEDPTKPSGAVSSRLARRLIPADEGVSLVEYVAPYARRSRFESDIHRLVAVRGQDQQGRWLAATGGNLSVSRRFFEQIGGFDPQMGLRWGVEDLEFGFRAERAGAVLVHWDDATTYHMDHPVARRESDHLIALQYFAEKHGSALGARLSAYFAGDVDITSVVQP